MRQRSCQEPTREEKKSGYSPGILFARAIFCDSRRLQVVRVLEPPDVLLQGSCALNACVLEPPICTEHKVHALNKYISAICALRRMHMAANHEQKLSAACDP